MPVDEIILVGYNVKTTSLKQHYINGIRHSLYTPKFHYVPCTVPVLTALYPEQPVPVKEELEPLSLNFVQREQYSNFVEEGKHLEEVKKHTELVCKHYLSGFCTRGYCCRFQHSPKYIPHKTMVFLCGLPSNVEEDHVREAFLHLGFNIIWIDVNLRNSWTLIRFGSVEEAGILLKKGTVSILGSSVKVRSYQGVLQKKIKRVNKLMERTVFLVGLTSRVTSKDIRDSLMQIGAKVVNFILIKRGYCPKVTLATAKQAKTLISLSKIEISGSIVDVRPYQPCNLFYDLHAEDRELQ